MSDWEDQSYYNISYHLLQHSNDLCDDRTGIVKLLWLLKVLAQVTGQPGTEGCEQEELFAWVTGLFKVPAVGGFQSESFQQELLVVEEFELVHQVTGG